MRESHGFDLAATPSFSAVVALISERFSMASAKAAAQQPDFERRLREAMERVECEVHAADFERLDVEVDGIAVDCPRYRQLREKTQGTYDTIAGPVQVTRSVDRRRGGCPVPRNSPGSIPAFLPGQRRGC